ncbi:MAG: hypothetical protein P9F75_08830 [Candidatus Contendobacter sp.]|nr:hypothetical protein [Candidatus Contendobacter sp.]
MARKAKFRHGLYFPIARLAATAQVSESAIVAAAKICGALRFGGHLWFSSGRVTVDFVEEAQLAHRAELAAAQRRQRAAQAQQAGSPHPAAA